MLRKIRPDVGEYFEHQSVPTEVTVLSLDGVAVRLELHRNGSVTWAFATLPEAAEQESAAWTLEHLDD